jgi:SAM-dependent methyltransferase
MENMTLNLKTALAKAQSMSRQSIGHNDEMFLQRIYGEGLNKYTERLRAIGFAGHEHVLDAGCGFGQWSLALAGMNQKVSACDISPLRVDFLGNLARELAVPNLDFRVSGIDELPYADDSFDAIFCYGVVFLTPWRKSLMELTRVLKLGGTLYVNANGLGWYMFLWQEEHNKADDYDPKAIAARTFTDTLRYDRENVFEPGMNLIIEPSVLEGELQKLGFSAINSSGEGCIHIDPSTPTPNPFFKGDYKGQIGVYEILATLGNKHYE